MTAETCLEAGVSLLVTAPELLASAAADLESIGFALNAANAAAAGPTTALAAAGADEVSAAVAALLAEQGRQYQALAGQVAAFDSWFKGTLTAGANAYASAETVHIDQLVSSVGSAPLNAVNVQFQQLTGRPLTGNGANGYTNSQGVGTAGGAGGWPGRHGGARGTRPPYRGAGGAARAAGRPPRGAGGGGAAGGAGRGAAGRGA